MVCDKSKLDYHGCVGAPDWIIEILSASTASKDLREKYDLYEYSGVSTYWIIHPHEESVQVCVLNDTGKYEGQTFALSNDKSIKASLFPDFVLQLEDIFAGQ